MTPTATLPRARPESDRSRAHATTAAKAADRRGGLNVLDTRGAREAIADIRRVLPGWAGQSHWLEVVEHFLSTKTGARLCRRLEVSPKTVYAEACNVARLADGTGLVVSESKVVAAAHLNRDPKTIQRARRALRKAGLAVEVYSARELRYEERVSADRKRGKREGRKFTGQRGFTNVYALGFFSPQCRAKLSTGKPGFFARVMGFVPLPSVGGRTSKTWRQIELSLSAAGAAKGKAPPSAALRRKRGRPAAAFTARFLANPHLESLFRGVSVAEVIAQLTPYQRGGWDPNALARMIHAEALRRGVDVDRKAWRPHGLLKTLLAVHAVYDDEPAPVRSWRTCAACVDHPGWVKDDTGAWWECDHHSPVDEGVLF